MSWVWWNWNEINIDDVLSYNITINVINGTWDQEPKSIKNCQQRNDWSKWKYAIGTKLDSLSKRNVFGPAVHTPESVKPVGYKWVFVQKWNENDEIMRYKAQLVTKGFSQRPSIDLEETYSLVLDASTFRYLISLVAHEWLNLHLMDVVTTYLYGFLDNDIYMKFLEGFNLPN